VFGIEGILISSVRKGIETFQDMVPPPLVYNILISSVRKGIETIIRAKKTTIIIILISSVRKGIETSAQLL